MIRTLIGLAAAASLSSLALAQSTSDARSIDSFEQLDAGGNFDLRFEPSETASIRFEGDADDIAKIDIDESGDQLEIRQRRGASGWFGRRRDLDVVVYVSGPNVSSFQFSRGVDAQVSSIRSDDISINVSTGANVDFEGNCVTARINTSTGGQLDGLNFTCDSVTANASTGSDLSINAQNALRANVSTGADVRSLTHPADLNVRSSTGGDVHIGSRR